jgi:hypothetical protein
VDLTFYNCIGSNEAMVRAHLIPLLIVTFTASSAIAAETMSFESATAIIQDSCGKDIETNCFGVNLDASRLKECLARNGDSVSAQCRADYFKAFDAIGKRVSARFAVGKACEREKTKVCADTQGKPGETVACLLKAPAKSVGIGCSQALTRAGYR